MIKMCEVTFVIDCKGDEACKEIRKYMSDEGFKIKTKPIAWLGDHTGVKKFASKKAAKEEANILINKYHKKLWQVHLNF